MTAVRSFGRELPACAVTSLRMTGRGICPNETRADGHDRQADVGAFAQVRGQCWLVGEVKGGDRSTLVTLQSVENGRYGEPLSVIWEVEPTPRTMPSGSLPDITKEISTHPNGHNVHVLVATGVNADGRAPSDSPHQGSDGSAAPCGYRTCRRAVVGERKLHDPRASSGDVPVHQAAADARQCSARISSASPISRDEPAAALQGLEMELWH